MKHVVSISGGKDSTATYLFALEYAAKHGFEFIAVMADTGNEHPATIDYALNLPRLTGGPEVRLVKADFSAQIAAKRRFIANDQRHGRKKGRRVRWTNSAKRRALEILQPTGNPYLDLCLWKGRFPSRMGQFCTYELKIAPIMEQVVLPILESGERVMSWQGVRAEESLKRAGQPRFEHRGGGYWIWRPIHRWSVDAVFAIHHRHNVPPNPLYLQGMSRVGCMPCVNCQKREIHEISERFPEHIQRIAEWEDIVSQASKLGRATFFPSPSNNGRNRWRGGRIDRHVEWSKTTRGGRQYDLLAHCAPPVCASAYGLCE